MQRFLSWCCLLAVLFALALPGAAQAAASLPVDQWVGQTFVFLPKPANLQADGYELYPLNQAAQGFAGEAGVRLPYAAYVGHQAVVTGVGRVPDTEYEYMVYLTDKQNGQKLVGKTFRGQLAGLALLSDRQHARWSFIGKTVYSVARAWKDVSSATALDNPPGITVPLGTPLKVVDVWDGLDANQPLWLVVMVNGQKAALPFNYSWTNQPPATWQSDAPWQDSFLLENPQQRIGDSAERWQLLDSGNLKEGMTKYEVRLSWGRPQQILNDNALGFDKTVWLYPNSKLSFLGEYLSNIEIE